MQVTDESEVNYEQEWLPYGPDYKLQAPLILPNGKVFECDIKYALGNWAWSKGLTFAGVVSSDHKHGFEIHIKANVDNPSDWVYDFDKAFNLQSGNITG